ncbi:hypothetical protein NITHO_2010002 [Nitrolancea hollandica Lb]|uniref:Uncharacterized protein n=1 Tax=Nitrolancea hollandica Lb TaxID=1129897 RepID=I4EEU3_9BACT|nr:hypothetical protein NITHO_2010002 [Nitrolancea hollandica Lb]
MLAGMPEPLRAAAAAATRRSATFPSPELPDQATLVVAPGRNAQKNTGGFARVSVFPEFIGVRLSGAQGIHRIPSTSPD